MRISRWAIVYHLSFGIAAMAAINASYVIHYWPTILLFWNELCGH